MVMPQEHPEDALHSMKELDDRLNTLILAAARVSNQLGRMQPIGGWGNGEPGVQDYSMAHIGRAMIGIGKMAIAFGELCCQMHGEEEEECGD